MGRGPTAALAHAQLRWLTFVLASPCVGTADLVNMAVVLGFDAAVLYLCGFKALMYLALGTVMGGGMHPMAGHLISEHYMFIKVRESSSAPAHALSICSVGSMQCLSYGGLPALACK